MCSCGRGMRHDLSMPSSFVATPRLSYESDSWQLFSTVHMDHRVTTGIVEEYVAEPLRMY